MGHDRLPHRLDARSVGGRGGHIARRAIHLGSFEIVPSRSKEDELRLDLTLIVARLHAVETEEVES